MAEKDISTAIIAWISGTGGTKRVAEAFREEFAAGGTAVEMESIVAPAAWEEKPDLLVLIFAVHAFDAPSPVYAWLAGRDLAGVRAAVVSVSGGGEKWPNTGCRADVCAALEARGAAVAYETMLVMPCNWVLSESDEQAMHILRRLPGKVKSTVAAIRAGEVRRTREKRGPMRSWVTRMEKKHANEFPRSITISPACTGCGACARGCPAKNITIRDRKPSFGDACFMCFRCVYACPARAMTSSNFMVLKNGFDIEAVERRMAGRPLPPAKECFRGLLWKSLLEYIQDGEQAIACEETTKIKDKTK